MRYGYLAALFLIVCLGIGWVVSATGESEAYSAAPSGKINGITFEAPHRAIGLESMQPLKAVNASWVALTPFAFSSANKPHLVFDQPRQWWGERSEGITETVGYAQTLGLKIMIKPHVWVRGQGWPGEFELTSNADWERWEQNYRDYIISYARLADSLDVDLYCIGTEFRKATVQRPQFWKALIAEVKTLYDGKLTYAANWDNYENISFWEEFDYIGVDAYFPVSSRQTPPVDQLIEGWQDTKILLKEFSEQNAIPILFTEFGYRSIDHAAGGDWNYNLDSLAVNEQAQANAYRALFESFWGEPWFAGGFIWKWHAFPEHRTRRPDRRFTPQGKRAEKTIRNWYGQGTY